MFVEFADIIGYKAYENSIMKIPSLPDWLSKSSLEFDFLWPWSEKIMHHNLIFCGRGLKKS